MTNNSKGSSYMTFLTLCRSTRCLGMPETAATVKWHGTFGQWAGRTSPAEIAHRWSFGNDRFAVPLSIEAHSFWTRGSREIAGTSGQWTLEALSPDTEHVLTTKSLPVGAQ